MCIKYLPGILLFWAMSQPVAAQSPAKEKTRQQIRKVRMEILAHQMIQLLRPTRSQLSAMSTRLAQARAAQAQVRQAHLRYRRRVLLPLLRQMRQEIAQKGRLSPQTRQRLRQVRQTHRQKMTPHRGLLRGHFAALKRILTPQQLQRLREFRPFDPLARRRKARARRGRFLLLQRFRFMGARTVQGLRYRVMRQLQSPQVTAEQRKRGRAFLAWLRRVRSLSEAQFVLRRHQLSQQLDMKLMAELFPRWSARFKRWAHKVNRRYRQRRKRLYRRILLSPALGRLLLQKTQQSKGKRAPAPPPRRQSNRRRTPPPPANPPEPAEPPSGP